LAWGGFSIRGKVNLFCFKNIMDAKFYVEILQNNIPQINRLMGGRWRLQQDNEPKHTSRLAKAFLQENAPEVMDWPSNSPDLNPIENLWCIVKRNVEKRLPKNCDDLAQFMVEEWDSISDTVLTNLVNSMKERCNLVIDKKGERIPY
jgi:transposase